MWLNSTKSSSGVAFTGSRLESTEGSSLTHFKIASRWPSIVVSIKPAMSAKHDDDDHTRVSADEGMELFTCYKLPDVVLTGECLLLHGGDGG